MTAKWPELRDKTIFVWGDQKLVSKLLAKKFNLPENVIPLHVDGGEHGTYILDAHYNKRGHRNIAQTMIEVLDKYDVLTRIIHDDAKMMGALCGRKEACGALRRDGFAIRTDAYHGSPLP